MRTGTCKDGFSAGFCWRRDCPHFEQRITRSRTTARRIRLYVCRTKGCERSASVRVGRYRYCTICAQSRESAA